MILEEIQISDQVNQFLGIREVQTFLARLVVAGLGYRTDCDTCTLVLLLQSLLRYRSVAGSRVKDHALEVEPDPVTEVEARRRGHHDQIHEALRVLRVATQVKRAQLWYVELQVPSELRREIWVHTDFLQVFDGCLVVRVQTDKQCQRVVEAA